MDKNQAYKFLNDLEEGFTGTTDKIKVLQENAERLKQQLVEEAKEVIGLVEKSNTEYRIIELFKKSFSVDQEEYDGWKRFKKLQAEPLFRVPRASNISIVGGSDEDR